MVNELRDLMRQAVETPPADDTDLSAVLHSGRQRVRRRRGAVAGAVAAVAAVAVGVGSLSWGGGTDSDRVANRTVPRPDGPVLHLADAKPAVEGTDYDVLSSYTNKDLDRANGQYYDGVTDDGLILFRDGPHGIKNQIRLALRDAATGENDWLPKPPPNTDLRPIELATDRLVFAANAFDGQRYRVMVFDRGAGTWSTVTWPDLPRSDEYPARVGPDGRLYVGVRATIGTPPPGGWPKGKGGEADDSGAEGDTYDLWSVSLDDPTDVRDEQLRVGSFAFGDHTLVWSTATNGINDRIHVRDLRTGEERDFDPRSGERCNLLGFGVSGEAIMLSQYCGDYDNGRDDRVQVVTTDGRSVTTIQDDGIEGQVAGGLIEVTSYDRRAGGTYVYDPDDGQFVRVTKRVSSYAVGGPTPEGNLLWHTPYGKSNDPGMSGRGATQWLARWR